ncbi:beta-lactamase hydrolase domain-containing protein [Celeribacter neptunius]
MLTIANQMETGKIGKVAERGYKTIICNRPDGEGDDQPGFDEIARLAQEHGIQTVYLPIQLTGAEPADHAAFAEAIEAMPKPIMAYCRSGTRSAMLWSHWEQSHSDYAERERRLAAMQVGAMAPGSTSLDGRRAVAPLTSASASGAADDGWWKEERQSGVTRLRRNRA